MTAKTWLHERIYAPYKLAALVDTLSEFGIPPAETLRGTGFDFKDIENPEAKSSIAQYLAACRNAVRLSPNPAIPFLVGRKLRLSSYGMYGYALLCSLTLRDYFHQATKYHPLATPVVVLQWSERDGYAVWNFPKLVAPELSDGLQRFLLEQQLMQNANTWKEVAGPQCTPVKAVLSYPAPRHAALYSDFLGCPVSFGGDSCELYLDASVLDKPTQMAHKLTSTLMRATCERLLGEAKTTVGLAGEIYQLLMLRPGHIPTMGDMAAMVHLHERTMRRRLIEEGTSFGDIVDDVRQSLATEYLKTTSLPIDDIAALVGYSDAANFRRAFRRWTGQTPREYKHSQT